MSWLAAILASAVALAGMAIAITRPNVVHALIFLVAALIALAAAFFALGAPFAGAIQILIYAGAVIAVFVFVVMTIDTSQRALAEERGLLSRSWRAPAVLAALAVVPVSLTALTGVDEGAATPAATGARTLGLLLFGPWAVAVELVSLLLLAGLLAVRHLARRVTPTPGRAER